MSTFRRVEDIDAWQLARKLARDLYRVTAAGPLERDFALKNQIRRSAVSVMSNIAEGFERSGRKEFGQFLSIAKGSTGEILSQLYVARDQAFLGALEFDNLAEACRRTGRAIGGLMRHVRSTGVRGSKFKQVKRKADDEVMPETPDTRHSTPDTGG